MADNNTVARPYAEAAFELANNTGSLGAWSAALTAAKDVLADGAAEKFLSSPSLTDSQRLAFLTGLMASVAGPDSVLSGTNEQGTNFLRVLLEYGRVGVLPEISERFEVLKANVENSVDVTIVSAVPLSADRQQEIVRALKARFQRDVNLSTEINESLVGGAVIRVGDVVIDGSVRSRLEGLASALVA